MRLVSGRYSILHRKIDSGIFLALLIKCQLLEIVAELPLEIEKSRLQLTGANTNSVNQLRFVEYSNCIGNNNTSDD